jgi:hypothetical protein
MRLVLAGLVMTATCLPTLAGAQQYSERQLLLRPVHYDLDLRPDYETEQLVARVRLTVRNASEQATRELPLLLYRLMHVTSLTDEQGNAVPFTQRVLTFEDWAKFQANYVEAVLPEALAPGEEATVVLEYEGHLLGYTETGMLYTKDHIDPAFTIIRMDVNAYPRIGYPSRAVNRAAGLPDYTFRAAVTVPESLQVANLHRLVERRAAEGMATYIYESLEPSWRMDFAIAKYEVLEGQGLTLFHFAEDAEGAKRVIDAVAACLELYAEWFGPLRREGRFAVIEIPDGWGSQADATGAIQAAAAFQDATASREAYHEVSHFWNVDSKDTHYARWDEGLASFLEYLTVDHLEGDSVLAARMERRLEWVRERFESRPQWRETPMIGYGEADLAGLSYTVGSLMFNVLYEVVGQERFNRIIGGFYQTYADEGATTEQFVAYAKGIGGGDLDALFQDWLYTTRWYGYVSAGDGMEELAARYR